MKLAAVLSLGAVAIVHAPAVAELRMEERDGVLYVKNVESPQPAATTQPVTSPTEPIGQSAGPYRELIRLAAARHAVPPELVESVIRVESNFEARAVSPKGARGLMQLMPATAAQLGVRNTFDVRQNIEGGVRHLRYLVDRYAGNLALALAAYNAGVEAVARYGGIPPYAETQAYVARVLRLAGQAGLPAPAQAAESRESNAEREAVAQARTFYRYETADGGAVYSNLRRDRLSGVVRAMLEDSQ